MTVTPQEFIAAIELVVYRRIVNGIVAQLRQPGGRQPSTRALDLQRWYAALDEEGKAKAEAIIRDAAHAATFQFLCLLDGAVAFDNPPHAELRLVCIDPDGTETVLNEPAGDLHDDFNALAHPPSEAWPPAPNGRDIANPS